MPGAKTEGFLDNLARSNTLHDKSPLVKKPIRKFLEQYRDVTLEIKPAGSSEVYLGITKNQLNLGF